MSYTSLHCMEVVSPPPALHLTIIDLHNSLVLSSVLKFCGHGDACVMALYSQLSSRFPGTIAGPVPPPICINCLLSRRSPPRTLPDLLERHPQHSRTRTGRIFVSKKSTLDAGAAAAGAGLSGADGRVQRARAVLVAPALALGQDAAAGAALGVAAGAGVAPAVAGAVEAAGHDGALGHALVVGVRAWEKQVLSARGFKGVGWRSEYAI